MNAHRHRIIFNRARGLFMAVAEIASAQGKCPGDGSGAVAVAPPGFSLARLRPAAFAALLACGAQLALMPAASAQVVAYKAAPASQRPTILTAGNGVPLVNIQTPSAAGVSRNTYEQFDVQQQGVILNNSRTNTATQLGGWVQGNPWLARGSARVILNEVIAANPSQLMGYVEVAGSAAQVVIANPAGVTCNGCGFINASRATLTTGTPMLSGGNLDGYRVEGGSIRVEGAGMDASRVPYTDLIARAVEINAGLWAQTLKVTTGTNTVDAGNTQATPLAPAGGPAPAFSIDVAQLGGMYAGKIVLVGTEAGVGVRNAGHLGASAGEVMVTVDGRLINSGSVIAAGNVGLNSTSEIQNNGLVSAGGALSVTAATLSNADTRSVNAGLEGQALTINAGQINNRNGALRADTTLAIHSSGTLDNGGGLISSVQTVAVQDAATPKTLAITNTAGTFIAGQQLDIDAASLSGDGSLLSQGDLAVKLTADYTHTGEMAANGRARVDIAGTLNNAANMEAGTALTIRAGTINNTSSGQLMAPELSLAATDTHTLTNRGLIDGGDTRIDAITLNNLGTGRIYGDHLAIAATTLNNEAETVNGVSSTPVIAARGNTGRLDLGVTSLNNREGALIFSTGDLAIGGGLDANNRATGTAGTVNNASATIEALASLSLQATRINNTNEHFSTQLVTVGSVAMDQWVYGGTYRPDQVTLTWTSRPGVVYHPPESDGMGYMGGQGFFSSNKNNYVYLNTPSGSTLNFWLYSFTRTTQESQVLSTAPGQIIAGGDMQISADTLKNDNSHILAGNNLQGAFGSVENTATAGQRIVRDSGTAWYVFRDKKHKDSDRDAYGYNPAPAISSFALSTARLEGHAALTGSGTTVGALSVGNIGQSATGRGSLFRQSPAPTARYLIETDPRFASYRQWLTSDYMLQALALDPATSQKRLGDGFYEQRLINEQVAQLTGRRFLIGYQNEEEQYKALMNAGVTYAREWNLIPGVALSAEQMAQLTSDMVWLVEKDVTLADGSTQKVLAPQLYARIKEGDLGPTGGLLADNTLDLNVSGNLDNLGTLAGRQLVSLTADNINNLGGRITGKALDIATLRDFSLQGGSLDADDQLAVRAGRNITIESTTRSAGGRTHIDRIAALYVNNPGGTLQLEANGDIGLMAAYLINNAPTAAGPASRSEGEPAAPGSTTIQAGNKLTLGTVTTAYAESVGDGKHARQESGTREEGTRIETRGDLTLSAGSQLTARAAEVSSSEGRILASAGTDLFIEAGESTLNTAEQHKYKSKGFLSSKKTVTRDSTSDTTAIASTFSGDSVTLVANRDIAVKGSNVVATNDTTLIAGRDLKIEAAAESHNETHFSQTKQSGVFSSGGVGFTIGSKQNSTDQKTDATLAAKSTIGSTDGNITLLAGETYKQVGSDVIAVKGDIDIAAKAVDIVEARETSRTVTETRAKQSGLTIAITSPVITAVQTAQQMSQAAKDTSDPRMKALAAASTGLAGYNAANAVADTGSVTGGVNLVISIGGSKSSSQTTQSSDTAAVSKLTAGRDIRIEASGAGEQSDITLQGTQATAARNLTLTAEDEIRLLAAANTAGQKSKNQNSSGSVGISIGTNTGFTVGASMGRGKADGNDLTHSNTHVEAGELLTLQSGGDTTLKGAVAKGDKVIADIGKDLLIESLQDTSVYDSQQKSFGGSLTIGVGVSGSVSASNSKVNSDYASVVEQSGIRAGDQGFDVKVKNDTDLKGGAITSTQRAIDDQLNRFETGGELTVSDIQNKAEYKAKSASVNLGTSLSFDGALKPGGTSAGFGKDGDQAESMTLAAISGVAGNREARTGDAETGIAKIFDQQKVQKEIDAQTRITQQFGQLAPEAWGKHANTKFADALKTGDEEGMRCWGPDGACRAGGHAVLGGLAGGVGGAVGAGLSSVAAPHVQAYLVDQGLPPAAASAVTQLAAIGAGSAVGGTAGATGALNEASNNALILAVPLAAEIMAGGAVAIRACVMSPACQKAVMLAGVATLDKMVSMLPKEEQALVPGYGTGTQPPLAGPLVTPMPDPKKMQELYGTPPLQNPDQLRSWLANALEGYPADEAEKWTRDLIRTLPMADQQNYSDLILQATKGISETGRAGKQARLRELANDDKLGAVDRGWINQELNSIERGQRSTIRNPPGKDLAHERGREAAKGYDYGHSNLQDRDLHRLQHKYDDFGRANAERPLP